MILSALFDIPMLDRVACFVFSIGFPVASDSLKLIVCFDTCDTIDVLSCCSKWLTSSLLSTAVACVCKCVVSLMFILLFFSLRYCYAKIDWPYAEARLNVLWLTSPSTNTNCVLRINMNSWNSRPIVNILIMHRACIKPCTKTVISPEARSSLQINSMFLQCLMLSFWESHAPVYPVVDAVSARAIQMDYRLHRERLECTLPAERMI